MNSEFVYVKLTISYRYEPTSGRTRHKLFLIWTTQVRKNLTGITVFDAFSRVLGSMSLEELQKRDLESFLESF